MQIELGKPVISKDGERVGRVDRIALDYDTREVEQIIVHQGVLLTRDRIVARDLIERIEDDGTVRLTITAAEVERLPEFVEAEFARPSEEELRSLPSILPGIPGATGAAILWAPPADRQPGVERPYQEFDPARGPLFGPAAPPETTIEVEPNLPEDTLLTGRGTGEEPSPRAAGMCQRQPLIRADSRSDSAALVVLFSATRRRWAWR